MINNNSLVFFITKDGIEERGNIKEKKDMHILTLIEYIKDNYDGEKPLCDFNYRYSPEDVAYALAMLKDTAVLLNVSDRKYDNSPKYGVLVVSSNLSEEVLDRISELKEELLDSFEKIVVQGRSIVREYVDGDVPNLSDYLGDIANSKNNANSKNEAKGKVF